MNEPDVLNEEALPTPALLLDEARMMRNIERLAGRAERLAQLPL